MYKLVITDLNTNEEVVNTVTSVLIGAYKREEESSEKIVCSAHFDLWEAEHADVWCILESLLNVCISNKCKVLEEFKKEHPDAEV